MAILLRCACGQQHVATPEMAGRSLTCSHCGQTMTVPVMGKLAADKAKSPRVRKEPSPPSSQVTGIAAIAVGAVFLLCASGWLFWALTRESPAPPTLLAENQPPHVDPDPTPERIEPKKKQSVIPPIVVKDPPRVVEPKTEPPEAIEPITPKNDPPQSKEPPTNVEKKPASVIEPLMLVWKLKQEDVFYQEIVVTQKPTFRVQGLPPIASFLQYRIVSRLEVKKRNDDGSLVVEQKIEYAKLIQADELSKQTVEAAISKMPGMAYQLELSPKMDVTKFEGAGGGVQMGGFPLAGGMGLQMASLIDRDGWKELHQSTFFQMNDAPKPNARWSKALTHSWGALGAWQGQTHYLYAGKEKDLHKVTYALQLAYKAPKGGAIGLMTVNGANFQPPTAAGALLFDADKGKVVAAEERFRVKGFINVNLLGQNTGIEIDEDQHFLIRIHDKWDAGK